MQHGVDFPEYSVIIKCSISLALCLIYKYMPLCSEYLHLYSYCSEFWYLHV